MILFLGEKDMYDFLADKWEGISSEISIDEAEKIILSEYSYNAVSVIRAAEEKGIPVLGILDGYKSVTEAFGGDCIPVPNCSEGKQELAVCDTSAPIYEGLGHVMNICRGNSYAVNEETIPPELDCIARAETGEIIAVCSTNGEKIFGVNYYLNSPLTQNAEIIIEHFLNL